MSLDDTIAAAVREAIRAELPGLVRAAVREAVQGGAAGAAEYLTTDQAAELAHVSPETVRDWVKDGRLPEHRAGRNLRIRRDELTALLDGHGPAVAGSAKDLEARVSAIVGRHVREG